MPYQEFVSLLRQAQDAILRARDDCTFSDWQRGPSGYVVEQLHRAYAAILAAHAAAASNDGEARR